MQPDQAGINRDQNPEEQDQKRTEIIPAGPVSENTGTVPAPNGSGSHNNGPEGMPPQVKAVLDRVEKVVITPDQGKGPVYDLTVSGGVVLTLDTKAVTSETPALFKQKWTGVFVTDRLQLSKTDWEILISALLDRAVIKQDPPAPDSPGPEEPGPGQKTPPWVGSQKPENEYRIPDVLGGVSLGILRDNNGFKLNFYREDKRVGGYATKTPPWLSNKVTGDTAAALLKVCPDLGKVYTKEHVKDALGEVFKEVEQAIKDNPHAAALLLPPILSHVLDKVDRVVITRYKDGFGGGEPIYELFTGLDEDEEERNVTLSLGDMTHEGPGMFKRRWTAVFVDDFLEMSKDDWNMLRAALIGRAEIKDAEHTGIADALISELLEELSFKTFTELKDLWKTKSENFLLCEAKDGVWVVMVSTRIVVSFLKRRDYDPGIWTPKLSKELKRRGVTTRTSKAIRVGKKGTPGTVVRVWVFGGDALGFHEDLLWERATPPGVEGVTGENFVTGETPYNPLHPEKEEFPEQGPGGGSEWGSSRI